MNRRWIEGLAILGLLIWGLAQLVQGNLNRRRALNTPRAQWVFGLALASGLGFVALLMLFPLSWAFPRTFQKLLPTVTGSTGPAGAPFPGAPTPEAPPTRERTLQPTVRETSIGTGLAMMSPTGEGAMAPPDEPYPRTYGNLVGEAA